MTRKCPSRDKATGMSCSDRSGAECPAVQRSSHERYIDGVIGSANVDVICVNHGSRGLEYVTVSDQWETTTPSVASVQALSSPVPAHAHAHVHVPSPSPHMACRRARSALSLKRDFKPP
eukprot:6816994-Prymnesium_polylepis.1